MTKRPKPWAFIDDSPEPVRCNEPRARRGAGKVRCEIPADICDGHHAGRGAVGQWFFWETYDDPREAA